MIWYVMALCLALVVVAGTWIAHRWDVSEPPDTDPAVRPHKHRLLDGGEYFCVDESCPAADKSDSR